MRKRILKALAWLLNIEIYFEPNAIVGIKEIIIDQTMLRKYKIETRFDLTVDLTELRHYDSSKEDRIFRLHQFADLTGKAVKKMLIDDPMLLKIYYPDRNPLAHHPYVYYEFVFWLDIKD